MHALQLASANCTGETFKSGSKKRSTAFISATSLLHYLVLAVETVLINAKRLMIHRRRQIQ